LACVLKLMNRLFLQFSNVSFRPWWTVDNWNRGYWISGYGDTTIQEDYKVMCTLLKLLWTTYCTVTHCAQPPILLPMLLFLIAVNATVLHCETTLLLSGIPDSITALHSIHFSHQAYTLHTNHATNERLSELTVLHCSINALTTVHSQHFNVKWKQC
jgi:hypothetical protein